VPKLDLLAAGGGEELARVERLLLDIYSQISEPDGIYAVARSHNMLAQVWSMGGPASFCVEFCVEQVH
jgi:hypothetical protein